MEARVQTPVRSNCRQKVIKNWFESPYAGLERHANAIRLYEALLLLNSERPTAATFRTPRLGAACRRQGAVSPSPPALACARRAIESERRAPGRPGSPSPRSLQHSPRCRSAAHHRTANRRIANRSLTRSAAKRSGSNAVGLSHKRTFRRSANIGIWMRVRVLIRIPATVIAVFGRRPIPGAGGNSRIAS